MISTPAGAILVPPGKSELLSFIEPPPRAFILLMSEVPLVDATGVSALGEFIARCHRDGTRVLLAGTTPPVEQTLRDMGVLDDGQVSVVGTLEAAIEQVKDRITPGPDYQQRS